MFCTHKKVSSITCVCVCVCVCARTRVIACILKSLTHIQKYCEWKLVERCFLCLHIQYISSLQTFAWRIHANCVRAVQCLLTVWMSASMFLQGQWTTKYTFIIIKWHFCSVYCNPILFLLAWHLAKIVWLGHLDQEFSFFGCYRPPIILAHEDPHSKM